MVVPIMHTKTEVSVQFLLFFFTSIVEISFYFESNDFPTYLFYSSGVLYLLVNRFNLSLLNHAEIKSFLEYLLPNDEVSFIFLKKPNLTSSKEEMDRLGELYHFLSILLTI